MNTINYKTLYFEAEANTTTSADLAPVISFDHANRLMENINTLMSLLGIANMTPMPAGSVINRYKTVVTRGGKQVAEGDTVPLSKVERKPLDPIKLELTPVRKLTSAQAIQSAGRDVALNQTDAALLMDVRKGIRNGFFETTLVSTTSTKADAGATMQEAGANAWAKLEEYFEDVDATPVFFVNPSDVAKYLGSATVINQTVFGFSYIEAFLGMGTAIISPRVAKGKIYATATENLNCAYIPQSGDLADTFGLTYDESGLVGMRHSVADDKASIQTLIMTGVKFYAEDASGIIEASITPAG